MTAAPVDATRPRLPERFAYRALGWKLEPRHHEWIAEDVRSGRALRWRWVTCGVTVVGTQLLIRAGFAARGAFTTPIAATLVGAVLGLVIGTLIVRRQDPELRVAKYLRYHAMLPNGQRDPHPRGFARMDNYGVASIQLASVALIGLVAGYLPVLVIPSPAGRCVSPSKATLATIQGALRPAVEVRSVRALRHRDVTYIGGTTDDGQAVSWQKIDLLGGVVQGTGSLAATIAPALGASTSTGGDDQGYFRALRKVEACSKAAAAAGDRSPTLFVPPPQVDAPLGTLLISGSAAFDFTDLMASCTTETTAVVQTATGDVSLVVSSPQVLLTVRPAGSAPSTYRGKTGAIVDRVVVVDGTLEVPGVGGTPLNARVIGRIPCRG